jgi:hypothetical protein
MRNYDTGPVDVILTSAPDSDFRLSQGTARAPAISSDAITCLSPYPWFLAQPLGLGPDP